MLSTRPETQKWVKILGLGWYSPVGGRRDTPDPVHISQLEELEVTVTQLFSSMTHVEVVHVSGAKRVPAEMYARLYQLSTLRTFQVSFTLVVHGALELQDLASESLTLEDLDLNTTNSELGSSSAALALARSPRLRKLRMGNINANVLQILVGQPAHTFRNLTELQVGIFQSSDTLFAMLSACPNLTSLLMTAPPNVANIPVAGAALQRDAVPFLRKIRLTPDILQVLVPGRPIEVLEVMHPRDPPYDWSREDIVHLASGTATMKELEISGFAWRPDGMDLIAELFPHVEILKVAFSGEYGADHVSLTSSMPSMTF